MNALTLFQHPTAGGPGTAPGRITLVKKSDNEYVVWFHNTQDGANHYGGYHSSYESALIDYCYRLINEAMTAKAVGWSDQ